MQSNFLIPRSTNVPGYGLTNSFLHISQLKQRIQMLTKPNSSRRALWRYPLVFSFAGLMLMCTQVDKELDQVVNNREKLDQSLKLTEVKGEIFSVVENQPEFPGGMAGLNKYLSDNLKYPAAAVKANVQGRVFANFVVTKEGDIADVNILKGIGFGCDEEAIRVISRMPNWKPGSQDGKSLNVRYNIPIAFELEAGALEQASKPTIPDKPLDLKNETLAKAKFDHFILNGKVVPYETFQKNIGKGALRDIVLNENTRTVSITTTETSR